MDSSTGIPVLKVLNLVLPSFGPEIVVHHYIFELSKYQKLDSLAPFVPNIYDWHPDLASEGFGTNESE